MEAKVHLSRYNYVLLFTGVEMTQEAREEVDKKYLTLTQYV